MPLRSDCIVRCATCGVRWGSVSRAAAFEEALPVEMAILETNVPRMIRHWRLGHRLALGENAPRSFLAVIAKVAQAMAGEAEDAPGERLRLTEIES